MSTSLNTAVGNLLYDKDEQILYVDINEDSKINFKNITEHFKNRKILCGNDCYVVVLNANNYYSINADDLEYILKLADKEPCLQTIFYNISLANRLLIRYLMKRLKNKNEFCAVIEKNDAIDLAKEFLRNR